MMIGFRNMDLSQKWRLHSPSRPSTRSIRQLPRPQVKGDPKILEKNGLAGKKIKNFGLQMKLQKIITSFYQIIRKKILWSKKINYLKNNIIKSLDKSKFNQ